MTTTHITSHRRTVWMSVFLGLCVLLGLFAVNVQTSPPPTPSQSVASDSGWTPANGYRVNGKCYVVIGQGGFSQQVPCSDWGPVPKKVRQCAAGVLFGAAVAWWFKQEIKPAVVAVGSGCLAGFF